ncbi:MAG: prolipoprotein diacylglyceryl transferase [Tissierellales bacterium]|nr:prolipoprotein diacylglyceryl transferase [Tissierellales bacterium]MBN2827653.1 prolipoprotein diacylglyceryl transferase [Tissierellales bacterium]
MIDPVAFQIFGIEIMWYGILIASGVLIGTLLALRQSRRIGFREEDLIDLLIFAIPAAILGARLYYVAFNWDYYKGDLYQILNLRGGGLAIHGGIIAAVFTAAIFCKIRKINFWQIADITTPSIILGQAIGRWGNFINHEAYGRETTLPWGIEINNQIVHPTFLYESLLNFMIFIFLIWYRNNRRKFDGELFAFYMVLYSIGRFFIEGLRIDSLYLGEFRVAQLVSIITIVLGIGLYIFLYQRDKKTAGK